jgi:predicted metalloprotease
MRIEGREESENVEDRRSMKPGGIAITGGAGMLVLMLIVWLLGGNPLQLLQQMPQQPGQVGQPMPGGGPPPGQEELAHFVKVVLRDTEVVWDDLFRQKGRQYRYPKLVLFTGTVDSACGFTSAAVGPFYCPEDEKVYLDLGFYRELKQRFGAPGDFAQAYVVAHEIGHHVQKILGISDQVMMARQRAGRAVGNQLSVRLELQADFFAGVWAHHAQQRFKFLDPGDIEEALRCANAIGDDTLQQQAQGRVVPDSFTHGSSEQRMRWFKKGWTTGDMNQGDTFNTDEL